MTCKWIHVILLLVIAVFALFVKGSASTWVIVIAALALLVHALWCKGCNACWAGNHGMKEMPAKKKR
jgi:hypothetical protein